MLLASAPLVLLPLLPQLSKGLAVEAYRTYSTGISAIQGPTDRIQRRGRDVASACRFCGPGFDYCSVSPPFKAPDLLDPASYSNLTEIEMEEKRWGICYEGRDQPVFNKLHALNQSYVDEAIDFLAYFTLTPDATPWAGQGTVQDRNGMIASAALDSPHVRMTMDSAKIIMTCLLHLQGSGWHELLEGGPLRITPIRAAITGFQMGGEAITYYGFDGNPWANQAPGPTFTESQLYAAGGMRVHVLQRYTAAQDGRQFPFELQIGMEYLYGLPYGNRTLGGPDNSATPYVYVVHVGDRDLTVITDGHTTTNSTEQQRLDAPLLFSWGADSWNTSDAIRCPYHSKWRKEGRQSLTREIGCWANHLKWSGEEAAD